MGNPIDNEEDFRRLVGKLLDEDLDERERRALMEAMQTNDAYLRIYIAMSHIHAALAWPRRWSPNQTAPSTTPTATPRVAPWQWIVGTVAVTAAAFVLFAQFEKAPDGEIDETVAIVSPVTEDNLPTKPDMARSDHDPSLICVLGREVEVQWTGEAPSKVGQTLRRGWIQFEKGLIELDFFSGARLVVRGPAELELRSSSEIRFKSGEATCYVSELGRGFRILTGESKVIDLGTSFGIRALPNQRPEIHVIDGKVAVRQSPKSETIEITEQHAVRIDAEELTDVKYSKDNFPIYEVFKSEQESAERKKYEQWKSHTRKLSDDSSVLLHYTFEDQKESDIDVINRATAVDAGAHGAVVGATWGEGRWPMKSALRFQHVNDRILTKVSGEHADLTFLIWARFDGIPGEQSALLLTEKPERWVINGALSEAELADAVARHQASSVQMTRWMMEQSGKPSLKIAFAGDIINPLHWNEYTAPDPVVSPASWGEWVCLAMTYDSKRKELRQYSNGKLIEKAELKRPVPLPLGYLELGNFSTWQAERELGVNFRFYGAMDEVLIANRVLSPQEIADLYQVGKP